MKRCSKCGEDKALAEYGRSPTEADQLTQKCRDCRTGRSTNARCTRCGEITPLAAFGPNRANASGRHSHCRSCVRAFQIEHNKKPEVKARQKAYDAARFQREKIRLRAALYAAYGDCCACCGEPRPEFLTVDHIEGRKAQGHDRSMGGVKLYRWLAAQGYPDGFQILCFNCNWAKGHYGVCPHALEAEVEA